MQMDTIMAAVTRELTSWGIRDPPEGSICIVLFRVLPLPPFPSFLPQTTENGSFKAHV